MYNVQVEWGRDGLAAQLSGSDVIVIVDVLSFSTCVDVAVGRGAAVLPFGSPGAEAEAFARTVGAECATARGQGHLSLSPATLAHLESGQKVVLPSPNGAALSRQTGQVRTLTACLRNAAAVARAAERAGPRITVVAAGERWPSGALRPALEDWIGAGAVVAALDGVRSPEAAAAQHAFEAVASRLDSALLECVSGQELIARGYEGDVAWAAALNVSACVPLLCGGAFTNAASRDKRDA